MECIECRGSEANKESGLCDACEQKSMRKINGLLYLPALGLIVTILSFIVGIYSFILTLFNFFNENAFLPNYFIGILVLLISGFIISLYAAWLFFRRKKGTRRAMVIYYIMGLVITLTTTVFPAIAFDMPLNSDSFRELLSGVFSIFVWIPYFIISKRIDVVFCR